MTQHSHVLVIGRDRKAATLVARERFPVDAQSKRDTWTTSDGTRVDVAIYGENLAGRQYDRIFCVQQDKASPAALDYLIPLCRMDGRFERVS